MYILLLNVSNNYFFVNSKCEIIFLRSFWWMSLNAFKTFGQRFLMLLFKTKVKHLFFILFINLFFHSDETDVLYVTCSNLIHMEWNSLEEQDEGIVVWNIVEFINCWSTYWKKFNTKLLFHDTSLIANITYGSVWFERIVP